MTTAYSLLPITNPAFCYVHSDDTTVEHLAEVFSRHAPILVCPVNGDDYQREQIETAACEQQESDWRAA